jgi:hypothetical protein
MHLGSLVRRRPIVRTYLLGLFSDEFQVCSMLSESSFVVARVR